MNGKKSKINCRRKILDDDHPKLNHQATKSIGAVARETKGSTLPRSNSNTYQEALRLQSQVLGYNHAKTASTNPWHSTYYPWIYRFRNLTYPTANDPTQNTLALWRQKGLVQFTSRYLSDFGVMHILDSFRYIYRYRRLSNSSRAHSLGMNEWINEWIKKPLKTSLRIHQNNNTIMIRYFS